MVRCAGQSGDDSTGGSPRLAELLRWALQESGAERAYVALREGTDATPGVVAMASSDEAGPRTVSRAVLHQALAAERSFVCLNTAESPHLAVGRSVRQLALRSIVAATLPATRRFEGVLVLDSRFEARAPVDFLRSLVEGLAPVAGLIVARDRKVPPGVAGAAPRASEKGRLEDWIRRVAPVTLPVLIQGETGSGKERVAQRLHRLSHRARGPLIAINCAAFTESLLDAELFGAVRGAYTGADRDRAGLFERAHGGTLFLDEVGDTPPAMQARLLRVLETRRVLPVGGVREREVDVRLLAATHRDLRRLVDREAFRVDLFHRLAVLEVHVPPLRDRLEELSALVEALGPRLLRETGSGPARLQPDAWDALRAHDWPGNVRELHAVLARALLRSGGEPITPLHLELEAAAPARAPVPLERSMILRALEHSPDNLSAAARRIGWTRQKLHRRMRTLGIVR